MTSRMGYLVVPLMTFALVGAGSLFASAADARGATSSAKVHNQQMNQDMKSKSGGGGGGTMTPKTGTKKSKEMKDKEMKKEKERKEMHSR